MDQRNEVTTFAGQVDAVSKELLEEAAQAVKLTLIDRVLQCSQRRSRRNDPDARSWVPTPQFILQQFEIPAVAGDGFLPRLWSWLGFKYHALPAALS